MAAPPPLASLLLIPLLLVVLAASPPLSAAGDAHPGYSSGEGTCTVDAGAPPAPAAGGLLRERGPGRVIDITHAYVPDLPAFAQGAVTGPVVRLKHSMADGSEYNLSELRMECHTGTHVDAPGHINQGHFAAGLDVDTLDLDLLNVSLCSVAGLLLALLPASSELVAMSLPPPLMAMLLLAVATAPRVLAAGDDGGIAAHPAYADAAGTCGPASAAPAAAEARRLEEYDDGRIVDITHAYRPELPAVGPDGLGPVVFQTMSMANGSICNLSELRMVVHAGTHIDTPGHMIQEHFEAGLDADKLDLAVLNGSSNRAN
ncbi:hypothetical protein C2845_PM12G05120 [Panicum miliaceum]|uniref:Kynurenine formamidase-like n=1 Tax=Panicum miliaceum TaxID=4540 RepID=A0A3L6QDU2_PANMI|nr:hypothetical protein C2845_PM12G05120 [Panicum miliaceum]